MFDSIIKKFHQIRMKGYVESVNNNFNGIGLTFEKLLGKEPDNFSYPDYAGIEIKTALIVSDFPTSLISLHPWGNIMPATQYLRKKYGYFDYNPENERKLNAEFYYSKNILINNRYYFNLERCDEEGKLYLKVYDYKNTLLDKNVYWYYTDIKEALENKLKNLAFILASAKNIGNKKYYYYRRLYCFNLKGFDTFLDLLEKNIISIVIGTSTVSNSLGDDKYNMHVQFRIDKHNISKLFDLVYYEGDDKNRFL